MYWEKKKYLTSKNLNPPPLKPLYHLTYPRASELKLQCKIHKLLRVAQGLVQGTRGDILYMWIYTSGAFSFLIPPRNWISLRLPLLHCDSWHIGQDFFFPPRSETHVNTWVEVSQVRGGRTEPPHPSEHKRMKRENELGCNIRCHVQQQKGPHTHIHTHAVECQQGVSVGTGVWGKEITLPVAQPSNEWKFDWSHFPICVCLSRLAHSECQRRTAPHTLFMSRPAERGAEWQITEGKLKKTKCSWATSTGREREPPLISLSLELYYGCSLISERKGDQDFHNLMIRKGIKKKEGINSAICQYGGLTRFQGNDISWHCAAAWRNPITLPSGFNLVMACFKWLTSGRLPSEISPVGLLLRLALGRMFLWVF